MNGTLLWLCGPSGVGKSSVGWELFTRLTRAGFATAYLDADQIGLCYPEPAAGGHSVKATNLGVLWPHFASTGATSLIFSGIAETRNIVEMYSAHVPDLAVTVCRLRASESPLRERFLRRNWLTHQVDDAVREAAELDRTDFADLTIDTDQRSAAEVADQIRQRIETP